MIDSNNTFTRTQQQVYDHLAELDKDRDTNGNVLQIYDDYFAAHLWRSIPDLATKDVLDFGCGPGRNLIYYHGKVKSIDGVDLAAKNLDTARRWITNNGWDVSQFKLYKNDGVRLGEIPSDSYDVVMSTICMQHISVHEIRQNLLQEFHRVLRPNGMVTLQFLYSTDKPNTVDYFDNRYDAPSTNGAADCVVGDVRHVINDLSSAGFTTVSYHITQAFTSDGLPPTRHDDKEWLFITGQKV
jgi:SAM-dependent methyltransferase